MQHGKKYFWNTLKDHILTQKLNFYIINKTKPVWKPVWK